DTNRHKYMAEQIDRRHVDVFMYLLDNFAPGRLIGLYSSKGSTKFAVQNNVKPISPWAGFAITKSSNENTWHRQMVDKKQIFFCFFSVSISGTAIIFMVLKQCFLMQMFLEASFECLGLLKIDLCILSFCYYGACQILYIIPCLYDTCLL
ncbi:hypothetical protein ACJX0J_018035, partial [Zea mays]